MRLFTLLWLLAAVRFLGSALALLTGQGWWRTAMVGAAIASLAITLLDWSNTRVGALVDVIVILGAIAQVALPAGGK